MGVLLTEAEAAKILGMSRRWLQRTRLAGGDAPPFIRLGGRRGQIRYRREDLDAWTAEQVEQPSKAR